ncbi:hypothetical protein K2173_001853 [Erythroxylum novogranatense]|uniref:Plectin/eS10 N-terminal domain-containing protein n=1 Tax=Erythroxylum novogranatense TaxID=1862640 RepID=A0AAV8SNY4_9ROSI|nr:hypothetical protein K2173_001853 [Erythroxylum novogranatense]
MFHFLNRRSIICILASFGVCYAKKDYNLSKHLDIDIPNLQYWYFTNDGIEFMRAYLNLLLEIVPVNLKKFAKLASQPMVGPPSDHPGNISISSTLWPHFEGDRPRFGGKKGYHGGARRGDLGEGGGRGKRESYK